MDRFVFKFKDGSIAWQGFADSFYQAIYEAVREREDDDVDDTGVRDFIDALDLSDYADMIPVVHDIDRKILQMIDSGGKLDMEDWHGGDGAGYCVPDNFCGTTHCRAGWAIVLAGHRGIELERGIERTEFAGSLIYAMSRPGVPVPNFFCSNEEAIADLRACAAASSPTPEPIPAPCNPIERDLATAMTSALIACAIA